MSSTAHLILLPWFLHWVPQGTTFDVALHLGTAAAVIIFFIKDWIRLIGAGLTKPRSTDGKLFWFIVLATIPGAIAGVALDKYFENFSNFLVIGIMLILMGLVLYFADKFGKREAELKEIGWKQSLAIGLAQVLAIIPGVSRSGITMASGRALGMKRESIAKFTFLLSAPIILADGLYHAVKLNGAPIDAMPFVVGMVTAAIVGALVIKFLMEFLKKRGFGVFAVYRVLLGLVVIVMVLAGFK